MRIGSKNIRRVGEVSKLFVEAGTLVLCSFISPFAAERQLVRSMVDAAEFVEIFVGHRRSKICIARDPKGLYAKANARADQELQRNRVAHMSGRNTPTWCLNTTGVTAACIAETVIKFLLRRGLLDTPSEKKREWPVRTLTA